MLTIRLIHYRLVDSKNTYRKVKKAEGGIASAWLSTDCSRQPAMPRESSFRKVEKFALVLVRFPPLLLARSERLPPAARARISRLRTERLRRQLRAEFDVRERRASDRALDAAEETDGVALGSSRARIELRLDMNGCRVLNC